MNKDTLLVIMSDLHSGSNYALFPDRVWRGLNENTHTPTSNQQRIRAQFLRYADQVKAARKNKAVKLVINGDAIDGDHHNSGDVCTKNELEQADIHIELMNEFQKRIGWQRGDEIYYTRGTQTHTHNMEDYIGREMNAVPDGDFYCHELLKLKVNGKSAWFVHHGPSAGAGANEGNSMRNWLKVIYFDALKDKSEIPDIVVTGHVHTPTYVPYGWRDGMKFFMMHGIILPSWQLKTRYAHMVAPVSKNKIGGVFIEIKADGTVAIPVFSWMDSQ